MSVAVPLGRVVSVRWEVVEVAGVSGAQCCVGRQGLAWELMSLGCHTAGLSADCWCFPSKPKSSWGQSPLGSKPCFYSVPVALHFGCLFQAAFRLLPVLGLWHPSLLCWSCCAISPWQVLEPVQDLVARPPEDAVWGWVAGGPS